MILVTEIAARKIVERLDKRGKGVGIMIGVRTTGCSGMAYTLEYLDDDTSDSTIERYEFSNFIIAISQKHLPYLNGLTIDWTREGLNEGFDFINPNEQGRCGCGESFNI